MPPSSFSFYDSSLHKVRDFSCQPGRQPQAQCMCNPKVRAAPRPHHTSTPHKDPGAQGRKDGVTERRRDERVHHGRHMRVTFGLALQKRVQIWANAVLQHACGVAVAGDIQAGMTACRRMQMWYRGHSMTKNPEALSMITLRLSQCLMK